VAQAEIVPCGLCLRMLILVFVALLVALLVVLVIGKRLALGTSLISAGVLAMAGCATAGGLIINSDAPVSLRLVTRNEPPRVAVQAGLELTTAGYRAMSISVLAHRNDLAELREHIKYELRRGNITAEKATTLNHLIDEIDLGGAVDSPVGQVATQQEAQEQALVELTQSQAKLSGALADTTHLVKVLGSVNSPEFAGTFIAAKIQVVRLQAEKAAVDGSIDQIRQSMKRSKAG
jgi:hypothetical protein